MNWIVKFSSQAEKYYSSLPSNIRKKIKRKLKEIEEERIIAVVNIYPRGDIYKK